jgi:hypothetical protein
LPGSTASEFFGVASSIGWRGCSLAASVIAGAEMDPTDGDHTINAQITIGNPKKSTYCGAADYI